MPETNIEKIDQVLNRGTIVEILPDKEDFRRKLASGKKMRFYIGFDATSPTLHLSHAKNIILMEKFRRLGHEVIILFGDFTARIGDPTGENSVRKQLTKKEVTENVKKWKQLIKPLMNFNDFKNPPKIMYNNSWLSRLNMEDLINLAGNFTVQRLLERDMFEKRIKEQKPIYLNEFLYPLMQGYDSVAMDVDVEVCGTDQIFNALAGRDLMKKLKNKDKFVVAVTLMENPKTGELMSKSKGTGVFLDAGPKDMYGQIMAQPDEMIKILFVNNTYLALEEIEKIITEFNPRDAKARLAYEITKIFYGGKESKKAEEEFNKIHSKRELPEEIEIFEVSQNFCPIMDLLCDSGLSASKSEAKRLIEGGGVAIEIEGGDWQKINDWKEKINIDIYNGRVIKVGNRKFRKIKKK